jgi:flavin reductase (DIM6/NTAB) family NADH-FMN oxidoreductase RutF
MQPAQAMTTVDQPRFTHAMSEFPSGVTVAVCRSREGRVVGATLSSFTSLSMDPPMVLVCFDQKSNTLKELPPGAKFALHVLAEGQEAIAMTFAGKGEDKLKDVPWRDAMREVPHIDGCAVVLDCTVADVLPGGDHRIVTALVARADVAGERAPLLYHRRRMAAMPTG